MRLLIILLIFYIGTANAGMYKCKDANGKTTYSQTQCPDENATQDFKIHKDTEASIAERKRHMKAIDDAHKAEVAKVEAVRRERHENAKLRQAEARASNAEAVSRYNSGVADRVGIKNKYLEKALK